MQINSQQINLAASPFGPVVPEDDPFRIEAAPPSSALLAGDVAVFNVAGSFSATKGTFIHWGGPLGEVDGSTVGCPWHGNQFNVWARTLGAFCICCRGAGG